MLPDLAGFGRSDKPMDPAWYTYDRHIAMAATLLEDLDLRGATFVVHDWGGPIGLRLAVEHRERVDRLVIMDTGLLTGRQVMSEAWHQFADFVRRVEELPIGFLVRRGCHVDPGDEVAAAYDAPFPNEASKAGARVFPELILAGPAMEGAEAGQRTLDALREDTRPMLMLWGAEDPALPPAVGEAFASALGRPAPQVLDGAGHFLQEDRGEDVGALIADWLRVRVSRRAVLSWSAAGALAAARASYSARAERSASSSERSALIQRPIASRQRRGSGLVSWISGPFERGTKTSKRGFLSADTTSPATSSGSTAFTRESARPVASSVLTTLGMTTETSTPVSRSSTRAASDSPTTPCLVAQ